MTVMGGKQRRPAGSRARRVEGANSDISLECRSGEPFGHLLAHKRRTRSDGWTDERQDVFFAELAQTANVTASCAAAGMCVPGAYERRRFDATFRARWRAALAEGYARLEVERLERALVAERHVRRAIDGSDESSAALGFLRNFPDRVTESVLRAHRAEAAAFDDEDQDGNDEDALARIEARLDAMRAAGAGPDPA